MANTLIQAYLFFAGRCDEALDFYKQTLGAEIEMMMRFNESPDPTPPAMLQPGFENKIMHSSFKVGDTRLMASDGCSDASKFDGFRLAISMDSEADVRRAFDALSEGGSVDMPLTPTFWSPCYGMLTDKFGLAWMLMVPGPTPA